MSTKQGTRGDMGLRRCQTCDVLERKAIKHITAIIERIGLEHNER